MKILLFTAPWEFGGEEISRIYPLGIAYLGAVLEKAGYETEGISLSGLNWEASKENIKKMIEEKKPDIVGISVMSSNRVSSLKLFSMVKEINSKIITIAGGVHTTFLYQQMLENYPQIDIVVLGEGEETIVELAKAIVNNEDLKDIKGIAYRKDKEIIITELRPRIKNLDELPFPKHEYFTDQIKKFKKVYIISSRGCPFRCKFCPSSPFWKGYVSKRSPLNILKEIKYVMEKFPYLEIIYFCDDEFIIDRERIVELCNLIIKEKLNIRWECIGRVTSIDDELVRIMKEAGCQRIEFGVESGSQKLLDNMNKKQTIPQIINAFEICRKYDLKADALLMIGLPGENAKTVKETMRLLRKIRKGGDPGLLVIYPGTEIYELAKEQGILNDDYWLTNNPVPFYLYEHSKFKLLYWSFKIGVYSHFFADRRYSISFKKYIYNKVFSKITISRLKMLIKKYFGLYSSPVEPSKVGSSSDGKICYSMVGV